MASKIKFDEYAKRVTYRRLGLVLIPVVGSLMLMIGYFAFQVTSGQQRKVVGALSRNIAANVINGDSFQLKSLVVSAVKSCPHHNQI